jgi:zinc protease
MQEDLGGLNGEACEGRAGLPAPAELEAPRVWIVHKPEATSVAVSMGFPIEVTRSHPDYPAMMLVAAWLGQHRQTLGRLMTGIREERGLNYGDYAYTEHFDQEGWSRFPMPNRSRRQQYFSIWLRPLAANQAHFAIRFAVRELRRVAREGLSPEQLETARSFTDAYFALYLQTESRRLGFTIDDAFYRSPQAFLERLRASWAELTPEAIQAVVRRHLTPSRLQIALIAPDAEALANAIATEAPSPITYRAEVSEEIQAEDREVIEHRLGIPRERIRIIPLAEIFRE